MSKKDPKDFSEPPFDVYIHAADETKTFKSYGALAEWAKTQTELWAPAGSLANVKPPFTKRAWERISSFYGELHNGASRLTGVLKGSNFTLATMPNEVRQDIKEVNKKLKLLETGLRPPADSSIGQRILEETETMPRRAAGRLVWAVQAADNPNEPMPADFLTTLIDVRIEDQAGQTEPRIHKARLTRLANHWEQEFNDRAEKIDSRTQRLETVTSASLNAHQDQKHRHAEEMARIENTFMEEMKLRAPADYWTTRAANSRESSNHAFWYFIAVSVVALCILAFSWNGIIKMVDAMGSGFNIGSAIVLTLPAVLLFWILRLISRRYVTGLATARDAEHRETMVRTYLALMAEKNSGVTDQDRLLILQALFRPENPTADDDAPPHQLLEIMTATAKHK